MTEPTPTNEELKAMWQLHAADIGGIFHYARAVLAKWGQPAQAASSAVLKAIREANMQLVRTGDDAFMLVPYKVATAQAAESVLEDAARWQELREQHEDDTAERCCVFAPNDMRECLVPVGSLPGELDAFMDSERAARKQGANHD